MIKVTVEGKGSRELVGRVIVKALRDAGIKTNYWLFVTNAKVANCRRDAAREEADVSVVAKTQ